jgi:hypothetical protein
VRRPPEFGCISAFQSVIEIYLIKCIFERMVMDENIARLRAHLRNIDRYQKLLKTKLTEIEVQYLERRLSEERSAVAVLHFTAAGGQSKGYDLSEALQ